MMQNATRRNFLAGASQAAVGSALVTGFGHALFAAEPGKRRIKIGQIGVQHAHATKLSVYRASPDYEVVGIVEVDPAARERAQVQPAFRDLPWMTEEQLLNQPGLDAVLVETPVRDLLSTAARCVSAGKHIHLDKPAGASLTDYQHLLTRAQSQRLLVQMGYMYRYNPAVLLLRDFLSRGWLGDVFEVHAVMSKVVGDEDRRGLAEFAGGIMFELGCHIIDLVIGVIGQPAKITPYIRHSAAQDDRLNDNMLAVFETEKALATVKSTAEEVEGFSRRHLVICGTRGTFHIQPLDSPGATIALDQPREGFRKGVQSQTFPKFTRYVADADDMARIIRGEKASDFSYAHDLIVQRSVLEASGMGKAEGARRQGPGASNS